MTSTDDTTDVTSSAATSVEYLELKSEGSLGPDGLQTTAPLDGTTTSISPSNALTHSSLASLPILPGHWPQQRPLGNYRMSNGVIIPPSPCIGSIYQHQAIVSSGFIPLVQRHPNKRKDTFNNVTDEDESSGSGE